MLQYPKMILFDYGHTLLYEPDIDTLRGERELFRFVRDNPNNVSPEQADAFAQELFRELDQARKDASRSTSIQPFVIFTSIWG